MGKLTKLEHGVMAGAIPTRQQALALVAEIRQLRRLLCGKICEAMWLEGCGDFSTMDANIRQWGFRLVNMSGSKNPILEEIR